MGDKHHSTFVGIECFGDDREVAEVDMIGRFVEYEESRLKQDESGKGDKSLLSFGEVSDLRLHKFSRDEEPGCG